MDAARGRSRLILVLLLIGVTTTTACSSAGTAGQGVAGAVVHDLGAGLIWRGPSDGTVTPFPDDLTAGGSCDLLEASVSQGGSRVELILPSQKCVRQNGNRSPLNGFHGEYLTPPAAATVVGRITVAAGALVTFDQLYSEYTNSRTDFTDRIGLITLATPPDADHPVLMLLVTYQPGAASADAKNRQLLDVAGAIAGP